MFIHVDFPILYTSIARMYVQVLCWPKHPDCKGVSQCEWVVQFKVYTVIASNPDTVISMRYTGIYGATSHATSSPTSFSTSLERLHFLPPSLQ